MRFNGRRQRFRAVLDGDLCVYPGSVFDPISGRIAESLGFEIGMFAGSTASFTVLGAPDLIVLTLSEFADQARRINRACELPLMVDADHGYGNALNVKRTVEELEMAGVSGLSIEDTDLPQGFGSGGKAHLLSIQEGVGKMKAALAGRHDLDLVIAGRTSAPDTTDVADAIRRAQAYEAAGVDAIFLVGVRSLDDLDEIAAKVGKPLILGSVGSPDMMDRDVLASRGVRICLQGHQPFSAAVQAIYNTLKALRDGVSPTDILGIAPATLMKQVTQTDRYEDMVADFLKPGKD